MKSGTYYIYCGYLACHFAAWEKILHYPTQGFGENQFPQTQGIDGKFDWNKTSLFAIACSACSNRSCSSHWPEGNE